MNTKALRQKILDLAIHGKLVPQDPNDEPASVLLEHIRAEKERLIKEGKIKKPKKSKVACDKPHYPFELPKGWEWTTVGEISWDLVYGTSKKSSSNGEIPVLRMGNINRCGKIDWNNLVYTSDKDDITKYSLQTNDLLFNRTNSNEWVGKTAIYKGEKTAIYAGYIVRLRVIILDADYVNFVMNSSYYRGWCNDVKTDAVNQSNINAQKLSHFFIPIPPLNEQKRIVNELSSWLNIIEAINKEKSDLQSTICLAKSKILDLAIHGKLVPQDPNDEPASELLKRINPKAEITCDNPQYPFELPKGWEWTTLGEIGEIITGNTPSKDNKEYYGGNIPFFKPTDLEQGIDTKFSNDKLSQLGFESSRKLPANTVLVTCIGATIGKTGLISVEGSCNQQINAIVPTKSIIPYFLYYACVSEYMQNEIKSNASATTLPILNKGNFSKIAFPLPPLSEQHRIVAKIEELFAQLDKIEASL